jgi:hypothetical protein
MEAAFAVTLFVFLSALSLFLLWYPVPLRKNVLTYAFGLSLLSLTVCAGLAVRVFAGSGSRPIASVLMLAAADAVYLGWLLSLSAAGEQTAARGALPRGPEQEKRLLEQLRAFNRLIEPNN